MDRVRWPVVLPTRVHRDEDQRRKEVKPDGARTSAALPGLSTRVIRPTHPDPWHGRAGRRCGIWLYDAVFGQDNVGIMSQARSVTLGAVLLSLLVLLAACEAGGGQPQGSSAGSAPLTEGDPAPDFQLPSAADGAVRLSDYRGEKPVLLYFSMGPG